MAKIQLKTNNPLEYIRSVLRKINSRHPDRVARMIDAQFNTADRISSAFDTFQVAQKEKRAPTGFESALANDAEKCLRALDLRKLRLPFWWKYGSWVITGAIVLTLVAGFLGYQWYQTPRPILASNAGHFSAQVQSLRGMTQQLGLAAAAVPNMKEVGQSLNSAANYLDALGKSLGSQELISVAATIKMAGNNLESGNLTAAGNDLTQAGKDLQNQDANGVSLADAGTAFIQAGELLTATGSTADPAALKQLGIGLANDMMEAREVIMNAASKLEFYDDENTLQNLESSLSTNDTAKLMQDMATLGDVLKDLNSHIVDQSIPLMERNIPWQDLANLEKMTSGWDDTWPSYVPSANVSNDLTKSPSNVDPSLSPEDAKALYNALVQASQAIASSSQDMELMRVQSNPEDLAKIAQDLQSAEMALKETSELARAVAANYITSIKLNAPTSFEDVTMPTATCIGPAWVYQQQESNLGVTDLWKMRYVSSYYGSLGIAGDQLGSAGEMLGSAFNMWNNPSDIDAIQNLKMGEDQLIGASKRMAMTLDNYAELQQLQNTTTAVESYSDAINKMATQNSALDKATNPQDAFTALSADMEALAQPFSTTPMYKPDVYYLLDQAGHLLGLAANQNGAQQQATVKSAADDISKASEAMFGTQEINLQQYGQFLEDIAQNLTSTTANTLGPIRKVTLDLRGLQELLGVQVKWEGQNGQQLASELDKTLVAGTVLLRPVTGNEQSASPNLEVSYYVEAAAPAKWPDMKYSGELLAVPTLDPSIIKSLSTNVTYNMSPEILPLGSSDIMSRYFLALAQNGASVQNWIKKEVPVKPGQAHVTVPPLPPDMPPRQPPSSGGGLTCPAVTGK